MMCTKEKYGEGKTCKDVPPQPKCVAEGDECTEEEKCCGDLTCASGKGNEGDCALAISFDSEECKKKTCRRVDGQQECLLEGGLAKGDKCDSTNGHKCCGKTMYCCFKDWICKDRREESQSRSRNHFDNGDKSVLLDIILS